MALYEAKPRNPKALTREQAQAMLSDVATRMYTRLTADRFVAKTTDAEYLAMVRAFQNVMATLNTIQRDTEIDDLKKLIEDTEAKAEKR